MQLLTTKFHIPGFKADAVVSRQRICRLIDEKSSIVILSAPAGFGKTTLLSEWVEHCKTLVAWVSLEQSENIPNVFWRYLITAVASVLNRCGQNSLEQIKSSGTSLIENILIEMINEIAAEGTKFTLVLDDFHVISDGKIHEGMEFLMDHLPSNMRMIIAGREAPRLSISKFRLSGKLVEINALQFRFNTHETEDLLNKIHGLDLTQKDVVSLTKKTEGWIAGLVLAILSMKEQKNKRSFIDDFTGSHRYIIDYLVEEVLSGLGDEIKNFMLKIAILERFCSELCRAVTKNPDSRRILMAMEQNNLFLIPLDNNREWFRYHHLFREFLLKHLMEKDPGKVKHLHANAFVWLKDQGVVSEAFHHGVLAKNYRAAADLLGQNAPELFSRSGGFVLKTLIERLPETIVSNNPELCSYSVWLNVLAGDFESVGLLGREIFKKDKTVSGFISLIKGYRYFYQTGEFEKSIKEMKKCLQALPEKEGLVREMGELVLGLSMRYSGDIGSAYEYIKKISQGDDIPVLRAISYADILCVMGKLDMAFSFIDTTIEKGKKRYGETLVPEYGFLYILKADILREQNEIGEALKACKKGLYLARNNEYVEIIFLGNLEYARILAADENHEESEKAMAVSIEAARVSSTWGEFMSRAYEIRMQIARGNMDDAQELIRKINLQYLQLDQNLELDQDLAIPYHKYHLYLSLCRYWLCKKQTRHVHGITDAMIREDLPVKGNGRLIECYVLKAIAYHVENDMDNALKILKKAFVLSEKQGQVRVYIDEGEAILTLFKQALKRGILPEYLKKYIDRPKGSCELRSVMINEFKETFNDREIEVLKLMKKGGSNQDIADTLFLSVNTVRWYAGRIFAKLNVKRRGEAVAFAEKYELI
ncbi:LuxR C-terminal-related transcriptional regulator [Desulfobacula phenolica]|uniref:LuxR family transcriptional regulator, maltose regulon positive regulatory protein n=1 Tax=Desulfobacula phenolica TaxID=90732 RepID=A0A1H2IZR1_9BACT|nr:LuxR C-terminal-related transcriptional regulator [Desulfobacula phenolica]SDU49633.1 LuxR family transcriptional regulator, maltose regulon positive regulatory protein [Desulfobacula phenolica]